MYKIPMKLLLKFIEEKCKIYVYSVYYEGRNRRDITSKQ